MSLYELSLKGVEYCFDDINVLRLPDISVEFEKLLVIRGRVGAGKTVLLKTLGGVIKPSHGVVSLLKKGVLGGTEQVVGYYVHSQPEFNFVTGVVGHELEFAGAPADPFSLYLERNVNELSGGELKRMSVMMALFSSWDIVLLDEPLDMLDDLQCSLMVDYIIKKSAGKPMIVATHDEHFDKYADVVININDGENYISRLSIRAKSAAAEREQALLSARGFAVLLMDKELSKISMESHAGEIVALFGMNGSGKTLFVREIAGIGKLDVTGEVEWRVEKRLRGFCMQFPEQMVYQESVSQEISDIAGKENVDAVLRALGWSERGSLSPFLLSDGEKRLMYIISLLESKRYCVFDEPFAGLDNETVCFIIKCMAKARDKGKGILYTTNRKSHTYYADAVVRI